MRDARRLWQAGSSPPVEVPVEQIVARAEAFRRSVRRSQAAEYVAGVFVILIFGAGAALPDVTRLPAVARVGALLIVCGAVFVMTYLALRGAAGEVRRDASTLSCYRAELARRRDLLASVTRWYLAPFWPGMLLLMGGVALDRWGEPGTVGATAATLSLMAVATVAIARVNRRAAAKLSSELEELPQPDAEPDGARP